MYRRIRYFYPQEIKVYTKIKGLDKLFALPQFHDFKLLIKPGEVIPPLTNFVSRTAYVILTSPSYEDLKLSLDHAEQLVEFS